MLTIEEIRYAVARVGEKYKIKNAYLFGSYAKGLADERSDVDLYVDSGLKGLKFVGLIEAIRGALGGVEVDVLDKRYVDEGSEVLKEIERTGVLIYEG